MNYRPNAFNLLPLIIKNIVIINVLLFLLKIVSYSKLSIDLDSILGLHFILADDFKPYQIITYMFMHGDFTHLFFNMFALWMFGSALENIWGTKRFILYYLITGLGAAFIHYAILYYNELMPVINIIDNYIQNPDINNFETTIANVGANMGFTNAMQTHYSEFIREYNSTLTLQDPQNLSNLTVAYMQELKGLVYNAPNIIGASGAVFGMLLAFGMMFPNSLIYLYFFIPIKAKYFVILYGALEIYLGVSRTATNVAHFAHLGGMIFGYILIKYWKKNDNTNYYL